jgi:hypothetical protein
MITSRRVVIASAAAFGIALTALVFTGTIGQRADAVELPGVARQMSVFEQSPVPANQVPPELAEMQARLPSRSQGTAIPDGVRLLGENLGRNAVEIYAFPTSGGAVCVYVGERTAAATCVDSFTRATGNVQWGIYAGVGAPETIFGLAADSVTDVRVLVGESSEQAALNNNSFFWQSPIPGVNRRAIDALLVRQDDGEVVRVDIASRRR